MVEAGLVESRPDLMDEVGGHPAALGGRVEADAVQPVAEGVGDPERLLGLVLERVDEDDPRHVGLEVPVEGEGCLDRVAEDKDERMGHRPGRADRPASRAPAGVEAPTHPPTMAA